MKTTSTTLLALAALGLSFTSAPTSRAAVITPPGLSAGDPYRLMFVSSVPNTANFGPNGITDADAFVQNLANIAGVGASMGVTWKALLSDNLGVTAAGRFNPSSPIYNMQGQLVAANGTALWTVSAASPLVNPIAYDEFGNGSATILVEVWTGTDPLGSLDRADSDWMGATTNTSATAGSSIAVNTDWINGGGLPVELVPLSVFAFSSELIAVPEPSTGMLAMAGMLMLATRRRRSQAHQG